MRPKLGELLVQAGALDQMQLRAALAEQRKWGGRLGNLLVEMRMLSEDELVAALSRQLNIPRFKFAEGTVAEAALSLVSLELCEKYSLLPVAVNTERRVLLVAMADPTNYESVDELQFATGHRVQVAVAGQTEVYNAIRTYHYGESRHTDGRAEMAALSFSSFGDFSGENLIEAGRSQPVQNYDPRAVQVRAPTGEQILDPDAPGGLIGQPELAEAVLVAPVDDSRIVELEERLRRVMTAQKEMINLLIEKGLIGKDELMARLRRVQKK